MQATEYGNLKSRLAGGVSMNGTTVLPRQLRRNMAANEARGNKKTARKHWFKKTP